MDIRIIFNDESCGMNGHTHRAKNVTLLCDYGCDLIIVENIDGSFERYENIDPRGIIRIEDVSK